MQMRKLTPDQEGFGRATRETTVQDGGTRTGHRDTARFLQYTVEVKKQKGDAISQRGIGGVLV
jgi:hypothetical protein